METLYRPKAETERLLTEVRNVAELETAPGGHLGVLTGTKARTTTWQYMTEFLRSVDRNDSGADDDQGEDA